MARIKIELPATFPFSTQIPVRITDINYGDHVGNDTILSIIHEARVQFLISFGYKELEFEGLGMIMADVGIEFKNELYYGDIVLASVAIQNITRVSFDLYYKLEKEASGKIVLVAAAKTGMVCYNYTTKKIAAIPEQAIRKFQS